eukprot:TRINITY_DN26552_c0_g1_i1.p1 TRINITY_DN26552_c0_g1~~TRINITY_DN26552_c0_g1_i1.p1  ORF type:complete len:476 (+),score=18.06 TRINITY_DN26552_c0_g1_i1:438-1865(+)
MEMPDLGTPDRRSLGQRAQILSSRTFEVEPRDDDDARAADVIIFEEPGTNFFEAYRKELSALPDVRLLVIGPTRAGKSSFIKYYFGLEKEPALEPKFGESNTPWTDIDKPWTDPTGAKKVVMHDSEGITRGGDVDYLDRMRTWLNARMKLPEAKDHIHCCLFFIKAGDGVFQPYDQKVCRLLAQQVPLIFVLTWRDQTDDAHAATLKEKIDKAMDGVEHRGVFCIATPSEQVPTLPKQCPGCGGAEIRQNAVENFIKCSSTCGWSTDYIKMYDLNDLEKAMVQVLPKLLGQAFITSSRRAFRARVVNSAGIIAQHAWPGIAGVVGFGVGRMIEEIRTCRMTAQLGVLWGMKPEDSKKLVELIGAKASGWTKASFFLSLIPVIGGPSSAAAIVVKGVLISLVFYDVKRRTLQDELLNIDHDDVTSRCVSSAVLNELKKNLSIWSTPTSGERSKKEFKASIARTIEQYADSMYQRLA